jgi:hypothetical protein
VSFLQFWELLSYVATALGIPAAILAYWRVKTRERHEREYAAYHAVDEKYADYLRLCIEHPRLDLYYLALEEEVPLTPEEKVQQLALCEILIAVLERAFLMYRDQATAIKRVQWEGWDAYMHDWAKRRNFRTFWAELGEQFDEDFVRYMNPIVAAQSVLDPSPERTTAPITWSAGGS